MGLLNNLLDGFKSKEQQERERREFEQRVFPLGMQQRECARAVLRELLTGRLRDEERLFAFISAKDRYKQAVDLAEGLEAAEHYLKTQKWVPEGQIPLVLALVKLDDRAASLEDYPTAEQVREAAGVS